MKEKLIHNFKKDKSFYIDILKDQPNNYEALLKLGLIDVNDSNFVNAKKKFKKLLKINNKRYEAHLNLSNIFSLEGDVDTANHILENFLINVEENIPIINTIGINLFNAKKYEDLEKHINKFINKFESHILYFLKGYLLTKNGRIIESEDYFIKSIKTNTNFWSGYDLLFKQYEKQSRLKEFKALLDKAKTIYKNNIKLFYYESLYLFRIKEYKPSLNILTNTNLAKKFTQNQNEKDIADYYHLLSRVHEKLEMFNKSYNFAIKRNKTILGFKENKKFKKELILDTISVYKKFFDKKNKFKLNDISIGIDHSNLVFLIGFPRSGTTLLDTILRSHSQTLVLEEKPFLLDVRHEFYKNKEISEILKVDESEKIRMQKKYFSSFEHKPNKIIIDKYPLNLIELGFIKTLFPKSKIILAIRHPLDCIISCVLTAFKMNDGMVNFENIHTTSFFYNECFEVLFKYFSFYEMQYHQVKYENIISDFKNEITKLIKFLNLNFEDNIYNYQKTAKQREKISTPSYDQVVQPLYTSSINRHKNFDEIKKIETDISRWINKFSY